MSTIALIEQAWPFLLALSSVVLIDLVLAGDNAIVVGMAAARLPVRQQRRVIAIGIALALVFRVAFALLTAELLQIVGLLLAGGLLLLWVAWKLWRDLRRPHEDAGGGDTVNAIGHVAATASVGACVLQIAIADLSMSLDNVLAVAGAAGDNPWILGFGLVLSVVLMGVAANYVARVLYRYRWLGYVGLSVIAYVALSMIWTGGIDVATALASGQ
jgi:YjbE family integral membrane protein